MSFFLESGASNVTLFYLPGSYLDIGHNLVYSMFVIQNCEVTRT